jgi:putative FmdB family regulatory protein
MPLYEYRCQGCGAVTDASRPFGKRNEPGDCPCGGIVLRNFDPKQVQVLIPGHFQKHVHTTGLKDEMKGDPSTLPKKKWNNPFGI